jgi:hypothetical protein
MNRIGHRHSYFLLNSIERPGQLFIRFQCGCGAYRSVRVADTLATSHFILRSGEYVVDDDALDQLERENRPNVERNSR